MRGMYKKNFGNLHGDFYVDSEDFYGNFGEFPSGFRRFTDHVSVMRYFLGG